MADEATAFVDEFEATFRKALSSEQAQFLRANGADYAVWETWEPAFAQLRFVVNDLTKTRRPKQIRAFMGLVRFITVHMTLLDATSEIVRVRKKEAAAFNANVNVDRRKKRLKRGLELAEPIARTRRDKHRGESQVSAAIAVKEAWAAKMLAEKDALTRPYTAAKLPGERALIELISQIDNEPPR